MSIFMTSSALTGMFYGMIFGLTLGISEIRSGQIGSGLLVIILSAIGGFVGGFLLL